MVVKWIECTVKENMKEAFSAAQEQWGQTAGTPGFIAQTGGWDAQDKNLACIAAFWEDEKALSRFMKDQHDDIFNRNLQKDTYHNIQVRHFNMLFEMKGSSRSLSRDIHQGEVLRVADCLVKPGREQHFETMQQQVWKPGMQSAHGMLGGCFSKLNHPERQYLVTTFWDSPEHHERYKQEQLPILQKQANIQEDIEHITGRLILLEDGWKI